MKQQMKKSDIKTRRQLLAVAVAGCFVTSVHALPTDPSALQGVRPQDIVTNGQVMTITTSSQNAMANWRSFSIDVGQTVRIDQLSASSRMLNQVVGNGISPIEMSHIYGTLSSNGQVWLVNPTGIVVGAGGIVDTAGFVASSLHVRPEDFLAGRLSFQATAGAGDVVNRGEIRTPSGGFAYLVGTNVANEGIINTPNGETILAAGATVNLIDTATPGVKVEITGDANNATNLGSIVAEAGRIGIAGAIVRHSGTLDASSVINEGGRIFLKASQDTYVDGNGRIVATGTKGGQVEVLGNRVAVMDNAEIDVSGTDGGGSIKVGGDYQGKNPEIQNAQVTYFGPDATLKANATEVGVGGTVIVWADDTTRAYGRIEAKGGASGGDGGFVEVSGKQSLGFSAQVNTSAPTGKTGTLLLDPTDITIVAGSYAPTSAWSGTTFVDPAVAYGSDQIGWDEIIAQLGSNNVVIQTSSSGSGTGNITIAGSPTGGTLTVTHTSPYFTSSNTYTTLYNSTNKLSLLAENAINVYRPFGNAGTGAIELIAGWNGNLTTPDVGAYAANKSIELAPNGAAPTGFIISNGNVTLKAAGTVGFYSNDSYGPAFIDMTTGTLSITADEIYLQANGVASASIRSNGDQYFTLTGASGATSRLYLEGGNSGSSTAGGYASIERFGGAGGQSFTFLGGADLTLQGGNSFGIVPGGWGGDCGYVPGSNCSSNFAGIENYGAGNQTFAFSGATGYITLTGGSVGNNNGAWIDQEGSGAQIITGAPIIAITGGASGGNMVTYLGENYQFDNGAGISSEGVQTINAQSIALTGGGGNFAGAYIGGKTQTISVNGAVTLTGGSAAAPGAAGAPGEFIDTTAAMIGWDESGHTLNLTADSITLNGGAVSDFGGSPAAIGTYMSATSTTVTTTGGSITLSGAGVGSDWIGSFGGAGGSVTLASYDGIALGSGRVGTGATGSVTLVADGDISQNVDGTIWSGSLVAASSGDAATINLQGQNKVAAVSLVQTGTGAIGAFYNSVMSFYLTASGSGYIDTKLVDTGYGGDLVLGTVSAGDYIWAEADGSLTANGPLSAATSSVHLFAGQGGTGMMTLNNNISAWTNTEFVNDGGSISQATGTITLNSTTGSTFVTFDNTSAPAGSYIALNVIDTPDLPVTVSSRGAILDNNGSALNIKATDVTLTSLDGGNSGQLAISVDTQATGDIYANAQGTYGGIRVTNDGSLGAPGSVSLSDETSNGGPTSFTHVGDLDENTSISIDTSGDAALMVTGDFDTTGLSFGSDPANLLLGAGGNLTVTTDIWSPGSTQLAAGSTLTVTSDGVVQGGSILLVAPTIQNDGAVWSVGSTQILANDYMSLGGQVQAFDVNADIVGMIGNDMKLNDGAYLQAGRDVTLNFLGGTSTLYLNETTGMSPAYIQAESPDTIYLNFLSRSSGGVVIDGVETTTSTSGGSGFFNTGSMIPATLGSGLMVTYSGQTSVIEEVIKPVDPCLMNPDACNIDIGGLANPDAGDDQSAGGGEDEFGEGDNGKGKGKKKAAQCKG